MGFFNVADHVEKEIQLLLVAGIDDLLRELHHATTDDLIKRGHGQWLNLLPRGIFNRLEHAHFARRDEQDGTAGAPRTAGAADAMHIGFGVVGNVVVDDVADARHIQTACGDVGGHHDVDAACLEAFNHLFA